MVSPLNEKEIIMNLSIQTLENNEIKLTLINNKDIVDSKTFEKSELGFFFSYMLKHNNIDTNKIEYNLNGNKITLNPILFHAVTMLRNLLNV